MIRRPPRSTLSSSSAASDVYKRQIQQRAVKRGLERREIESVPVIGIDEKAYKKGHRYLTLVYDHANSRVLYVGDERKESSLQGFWDMLSADQKAGIEAVSMDMWDPFINSVRANVPNAEEKIVFDKFHIASHLGNAVDLVRRGENKTLRSCLLYTSPSPR